MFPLNLHIFAPSLHVAQCRFQRELHIVRVSNGSSGGGGQRGIRGRKPSLRQCWCFSFCNHSLIPHTPIGPVIYKGYIFFDFPSLYFQICLPSTLFVLIALAKPARRARTSSTLLKKSGEMGTRLIRMVTS